MVKISMRFVGFIYGYIFSIMSALAMAVPTSNKELCVLFLFGGIILTASCYASAESKLTKSQTDQKQ